MIYGIGIDIVKVERMEDAHKKWGRKFFEKILNDAEIEYCFKKRDPYPSLSVRFAAKEALIKAISADINVNMKNIEIAVNKVGNPVMNVSGNIEAYFQEKGINHSHVTLSHEKEFAVACVILEK